MSNPSSLSDRTGGTLIDSFPTELLLLIFTFAYLDTRHNFRTSNNHQSCLRLRHLRGFQCKCTKDERAWSSDWRGDSDELVSPLIFPYTLPPVCHRWRDVMESLPVFWTRVIALVDDHPTALARIQKQLQLSQDLELDVFVLRRPDTYTLDDAAEHARSRAVINIIMPHLHRCRTISFDLISTSSLPSIYSDFHGAAPSLTHLALKGRVDDGKAPGEENPSSIPAHEDEPFHCPKLAKIDIDGRNFAHAGLDLPMWKASLAGIPHDKFLSITLSNFTPRSPWDHQFTLHEFIAFMASLPTLGTLKLNDVQFNYDDFQPLAHNLRPTLSVSSITLTGLTAEFMAPLLDGIDFDMLEFMSVNRCGITGAHVSDSANLTLRDISADEDMRGFLDGWNGWFIDVVRCPGFDDAALRTFEPDFDRTLYMGIEDCDGFTVNGLMEMVKVMTAPGPFEDWGSVRRLSVSGRAPHAPSEEEVQWFERNVEGFSWKARERFTEMDETEVD